MERKFRRALEKHFNRERLATLRAARKKQIYSPDADALAKIIKPFILDAAEAGVDDALEPLIKFGVGFDETLVNEAARDWAINHIYGGYEGGVAKQINATTEKGIQKAVSAWFESGDRIEELIRALEPTFGAKRAEMIAVTEVTEALSGSALASWKSVNEQLGAEIVSGMAWTTANDELVCPVCSALGGLTYGSDGAIPADIADQERRGVTAALDGHFVHPGGKGLQAHFEGRTYQRPPAHPRCRCTLSPVIKT